MKIKNYKQIAFENVRMILYAVVIINGLFIQYIAPFHYLCDYDNYSCIMCGMRYAVDEMMKGHIFDAYQSNHFIIVLLGFLFFFCVIRYIFYIREKGAEMPLKLYTKCLQAAEGFGKRSVS